MPKEPVESMRHTPTRSKFMEDSTRIEARELSLLLVRVFRDQEERSLAQGRVEFLVLVVLAHLTLLGGGDTNVAGHVG